MPTEADEQQVQPVSSSFSAIATKSSAAAPRPSRIFIGNREYVNFYNRFVNEVFTYTNSFATSNLRDSVITHDGTVYNRSENGTISEEETPGTLWTWKEKELFFDALSKCSIHRIDLIQERIGTKSVLEIMNYYSCLCKQTDLLKNKKSTVMGRFGLKRNWSPKLMRYHEMPIAYEISPFFTNFEELQTESIGYRERTFELAKATKSKPSYELYQELALINLENFKKLYSLNLGFPALILVEELVRLITKQIIMKLLDVQVVLIKKSDVYRAVSSLNYRKPDSIFNYRNMWIDVGDYQREHSNLYEPVLHIDPCFTISQKQTKPEKKPNGPIHINSLKRSTNIIELDEDLEDLLIEHETEELEELDYINSKAYERGLATMLMKDAKFDEKAQDLADFWQMEQEEEIESEEEVEIQATESYGQEMEVTTQVQPINIDPSIQEGMLQPSEKLDNEKQVQEPPQKKRKISPEAIHQLVIDSFAYTYASYEQDS